jgi:FKBP12-rapamycin complex-associated protein
MRVLRENNDSLMAVLEAFVYDPLISWRLTAGQEPGGNGEQQSATRSSKILTISPCKDAGGATTDQAKALMGGPNRKLKADENDIFGESYNANNKMKP